jgi:DNA-directed RNA polymerase subunit RPC12/RpoP
MVLERLRDRLAGSDAYRCGLCAQPFDRERLNCPACGSSEIVTE